MNRSLAIAALMLLLGASELCAQERLLAGPTVGYEFSVPLLLQRSEGAINFDAGFAGTGRSFSHSAVAGGQIIAPRALGALGYSARLSLFATSARFLSDPFVPGLELTDTSTQTFTPDRFRRIEVSLTAATLVADAQARLSIGETFIAGAGLWGSYRLSGQFTRTERPEIIPPDVDPDDATLITGGDRIASFEVGFGGVFTLGGLVPLTSRMSLMPELSSRLDAVALRRGMGFQSFTIGAGLTLLFDPHQAPPLVDAMPVGMIDRGDSVGGGGAALPRQPSPLRLEARVDLFADGVDGRLQPAAVEPEEIVHRVVLALPRVVSYETAAFELPGGLARLSSEETQRFTTRSLAGLDVAGHWRHFLNVLGLRMRESKGASVTLTGVGVVGEPASLASVRAEVMRDYLVDVWGIDASRIPIHSRRGVSPLVLLDGPDELFSTPLVSQWRTRRYRMPQLGLERYIVADAGVRRWTLDIVQGKRELAHFASDSGGSEPVLDLRFIAGSDTAVQIVPLLARLTVEDSLGRTSIAEDELPLVRAKAERSTTSRGERLELITFDLALDSAQSASERTLAARRAARLLRDGASVTVGLVGRISDAARRLRALDVARVAEELLAAANERGIRIGRFVAEREGGGEATPAGIRIVVEQPHDPAAYPDDHSTQPDKP